MAGNGNRLSSGPFGVGCQWEAVSFLVLVGKVKMHCIYTQSLLIDFIVLLHKCQRPQERPVPLAIIQGTRRNMVACISAHEQG